MSRLFQAGLVAACFQFVTLVLVTPFVLAVMRHELVLPLSTSFGSDTTVPSSETQSSVLASSYLIISLGVALTENRFLDSSAMHIRSVSHLKPFSRPTFVMALLLIQFCLGAAAFTVFALQTPPEFLVDLGQSFGWGGIFSIMWPGAMSIGAAFFGANAHAALRALQW